MVKWATLPSLLTRLSLVPLSQRFTSDSGGRFAFFGSMFFWIVPLPFSPMPFRVSRSLGVVKYVSQVQTGTVPGPSVSVNLSTTDSRTNHFIPSGSPREHIAHSLSLVLTDPLPEVGSHVELLEVLVPSLEAMRLVAYQTRRNTPHRRPRAPPRERPACHVCAHRPGHTAAHHTAIPARCREGIRQVTAVHTAAPHHRRVFPAAPEQTNQ